MQMIRDLDVKSTNKSSSQSVRLWNQICNLHAKFRHHRNIQSSLTRQTSAYAKNKKNVKLHNQINTQLSKESKDIANIRLIASSQVLKFKLSTQLKKCRVELKFFWKSVELNWEVELKHSSQVKKLDLITQFNNSTWLDKILNRCK